jgi:tetratricopeptide (TPR) repeat protein
MSMPPGSVPSQVQGLLATADSLQSQGRVTEALATLQQARTSAQAAGVPALAGQVMVAIATLEAATGRGGDAMASMQQASNLFGLAGDRSSHIRAQIQIASLQAAAGQVDAAMSLVQSCLGAAGEIGENQLLAEVHGAAGQFLLTAGRAHAAADQLRAGLALATGLTDPTPQVQLRAFLAVAVFQGGDALSANSLLAEDARIARAIPDAVAGAMGLGTVCDALVLIQRPLDALTVGQEILARLQGAGARPQVIEATIGLANLYALVGRPAEAAQNASQAVAAARELGGPGAAASALLRIGTMAVQRGDRVSAIDLLRQARAQAMAAGLPEPPMLTEMLRQLGL